MVEEDRKKKLPANWEARKRKVEWEIADEEARKVISKPGGPELYFLFLRAGENKVLARETINMVTQWASLCLIVEPRYSGTQYNEHLS